MSSYPDCVGQKFKGGKTPLNFVVNVPEARCDTDVCYADWEDDFNGYINSSTNCKLDAYSNWADENCRGEHNFHATVKPERHFSPPQYFDLELTFMFELEDDAERFRAYMLNPRSVGVATVSEFVRQKQYTPMEATQARFLINAAVETGKIKKGTGAAYKAHVTRRTVSIA